MNHQHIWRRLLCALALWSLIACARAHTWWPEENCSADGGWGQCPPPAGEHAGIDVVDALDAAAFLAHYHLKRPVLIRGAANAWAAKALWTRESLCARFGNATVKAGTSAQIVEHLGNGAATLSLCNFARYASQGDPAVADGDEPQYVFDRGEFVDAHSHGIGDAFDTPAFWVAATTAAADGSAPLVSYFLLGAPGSGVALHAHSDGWNGLVYGAKRWQLFPPDRLPHQPFPAYAGHRAWLEQQRVHGRTAAIEFVQQAGDIVYIPEGWFHATVNMCATVGIAQQTIGGSTPFYRAQYAGLAAFGARDYRRAARLLRRAAETPDMAAAYEVWSDLALAHEAAGDLNTAMVAAETSARLNPGFAEAHYTVGRLLRKQRRAADAVDALARAVGLHPRHLDYRLALASAMEEAGRKREAVAQLMRAVQWHPRAADAHFRLGNALRAADAEAAVAAMKRAVELDPQHVRAQANLIALLGANGRLHEAEAAARAAVAVHPDNVDLRVNLAVVLAHIGRQEEARSLLEHVLRQFPNHSEAAQRLRALGAHRSTT